MRKVEEQMNMAIRARKNWAGSNTTVRCFKENGITTEMQVLLHGNLIAWLDTATNDLNISSAGWETVTTKSRLNALLDDCLLYTSPSPRDRQKSRMPSSA